MRRLATAVGAACVLLSVFAALLLQGVIRVNTPSQARYPVWGVDVSRYQGQIDWQALAAQGVRFAFVKATEGSGHEDANFRQNMRLAQQAGVCAGAYHFFSFESPGEDQARNLLACLRQWPGQLPCAIDVELYGAFVDQPPEPRAVRAQLRKMLEQLERELGYRPILYATYESYRAYLAGAFDDYDLWICDVYLWPDLWLRRPWTFWQYSDRDRLAGYRGEEERIDLNVFCGDEAAFAAYLASRQTAAAQ